MREREREHTKYCNTNVANEYAIIGSMRKHFIRTLTFELIHIDYSMYGFMKMEKKYYHRIDCETKMAGTFHNSSIANDIICVEGELQYEHVSVIKTILVWVFQSLKWDYIDGIEHFRYFVRNHISKSYHKNCIIKWLSEIYRTINWNCLSP